MRVTTGLARGRKLVAPQGRDTRPSSDMTKQAVFNIVQNYVEGSTFLDLFASTGLNGVYQKSFSLVCRYPALF